NQRCRLTFAPDIVDKQNNRVCAPAGGNVDAGCEPGDVSAFEFLTQILEVTNQSFQDGATGVSTTAQVILVANAPLAAGSLGAVSVTQNGTPVTDFTVLLPQPQTIRINWDTPLQANTTYTLSVSTALTDTFDV